MMLQIYNKYILFYNKAATHLQKEYNIFKQTEIFVVQQQEGNLGV